MEKCPICAGELVVIRDQPYKYTQCGLEVVLLGITQYRCNVCNETIASIPNTEQLHTTIALGICKDNKALLLPEEIKFLRKELGLKAVELARAMGVKPEAVSRWENGKTSISESNDRMLRMIYRSSIRVACDDENTKAKIISFLSSLPTQRKQIRKKHVIELNPQEWMQRQVAAC